MRTTPSVLTCSGHVNRQKGFSTWRVPKQRERSRRRRSSSSTSIRDRELLFWGTALLSLLLFHLAASGCQLRRQTAKGATRQRLVKRLTRSSSSSSSTESNRSKQPETSPVESSWRLESDLILAPTTTPTTSLAPSPAPVRLIKSKLINANVFINRVIKHQNASQSLAESSHSLLLLAPVLPVCLTLYNYVIFLLDGTAPDEYATASEEDAHNRS